MIQNKAKRGKWERKKAEKCWNEEKASKRLEKWMKEKRKKRGCSSIVGSFQHTGGLFCKSTAAPSPAGTAIDVELDTHTHTYL